MIPFSILSALFGVYLDIFLFVVKSEEEVLKNSLIASSISRTIRFLMKRFKEIKDSIKGVFEVINKN